MGFGQFFVGHPAHGQPDEIGKRDQGQRRTGDIGDTIDPERADLQHRRRILVDDVMQFEGAVGDIRTAEKDERLSEAVKQLLHRPTDHLHEHIDVDVGVCLHGHHGAAKGQPDEHETRNLFGKIKAAVSENTQKHIDANENQHTGHHDHHDEFKQLDELGGYEVK